MSSDTHRPVWHPLSEILQAGRHHDVPWTRIAEHLLAARYFGDRRAFESDVTAVVAGLQETQDASNLGEPTAENHESFAAEVIEQLGVLAMAIEPFQKQARSLEQRLGSLADFYGHTDVAGIDPEYVCARIGYVLHDLDVLADYIELQGTTDCLQAATGVIL